MMPKSLVAHHLCFRTRACIHSQEKQKVLSGGASYKRAIQVISRSSLDKLAAPEDKTPVSRVADLISKLTKPEKSTSSKRIPWIQTYKKLAELKKQLDEKEKLPGAKVYTHRMYDLVLSRDEPSMSPKERKSPRGVVRMAMDLFSSMSGDKRRSEREQSNTKFLSPRFAPLMPDKSESSRAQLSPSILAFYEEPNNTQNVASVPQIMRFAGLGKEDREKVMEMLMDVSGASDTVSNAIDLLKGLNFFGGMEGEVMAITERVVSAFTQFEKTLRPAQRSHMDKKGYAFLEKDQIEKLYRDQGENLPEEALDPLSEYDTIDPDKREEALWARIERIAYNLPDKISNASIRRFKRDNLPISVLKPTVLAPYMFSPVLGFSVLGPTVLSPSLFSPLILNPAVLSPYVLSPGVPMPFILSPYLLSPYVLSPLVMAPFILNPYVLSPNVLNPYVLSPLILSPLVLCPDVLSPMALGGAILSPSVASPAVLTENWAMASVLSPSFLS
ncbi:Protein MLTN-9 [Aphelenchoides avenae]|nr:Protein MLTN-9 [Aphelenchus avenae]